MCRLVSKSVLITLLLTVFPPVAFAAAYHHPLFNTKKGGSVCYSRVYSDAFLKKNPNVKLQTLSLERRNLVADGMPNTKKLFAIAFGASTKNEVYESNAYCKPNGSAIVCELESDGGSFTVQRVGKGVIIKTRRIGIEGMFTNLEIVSKKNKPTRSFTLRGNGSEPCAAVFD